MSKEKLTRSANQLNAKKLESQKAKRLASISKNAKLAKLEKLKEMKAKVKSADDLKKLAESVLGTCKNKQVEADKLYKSALKIDEKNKVHLKKVESQMSRKKKQIDGLKAKKSHNKETLKKLESEFRALQAQFAVVQKAFVASHKAMNAARLKYGQATDVFTKAFENWEKHRDNLEAALKDKKLQQTLVTQATLAYKKAEAASKFKAKVVDVAKHTKDTIAAQQKMLNVIENLDSKDLKEKKISIEQQKTVLQSLQKKSFNDMSEEERKKIDSLLNVKVKKEEVKKLNDKATVEQQSAEDQLQVSAAYQELTLKVPKDAERPALFKYENSTYQVDSDTGEIFEYKEGKRVKQVKNSAVLKKMRSKLINAEKEREAIREQVYAKNALKVANGDSTAAKANKEMLISTPFEGSNFVKENAPKNDNPSKEQPDTDKETSLEDASTSNVDGLKEYEGDAESDLGLYSIENKVYFEKDVTESNLNSYQISRVDRKFDIAIADYSEEDKDLLRKIPLVISSSSKNDFSYDSDRNAFVVSMSPKDFTKTKTQIEDALNKIKEKNRFRDTVKHIKNSIEKFEGRDDFKGKVHIMYKPNNDYDSTTFDKGMNSLDNYLSKSSIQKKYSDFPLRVQFRQSGVSGTLFDGLFNDGVISEEGKPPYIQLSTNYDTDSLETYLEDQYASYRSKYKEYLKSKKSNT